MVTRTISVDIHALSHSRLSLAVIQLHTSILGVTAVTSFTHLCVNFIVSTRVSVPEAEVGDRVVGLCAFQASDSLRKTILLNAFIKAFVEDLLWGDTEHGGDGIRGVHDTQSAREAIEYQRSARLPQRLLWGSPELGRQVL